MSALDRLLPTPRLLEVDDVEIAAPPMIVWERVRHGDLGTSPLIRALFQLRTLPERLKGSSASPPILRLDDFASTAERPGFQMLGEEPGREIVVGAIGRVWELDIPFDHVPDAAAFAAFDAPERIKVAWALRVSPHGQENSRVELELRVDATDAAAWSKFKRYFRVVGPASHFIRRSVLAQLARELGRPDAKAEERPLAGDELLPDAVEQFTHGVTIAASPKAIWPWLLQMGCRRGGFYSIDLLDNAGVRSAREVHPELQKLEVGQIIPATPEGEDGFEVLRIEPERALVLGGLFDADQDEQRPFSSPRPTRYSQVTWAFVLEPLDGKTTRLHVRARAAFPANQRWRARWIRPVHHIMQTAQLRNLAARVEGRLPREDWRDVLEGAGGAAAMVLTLLTPFLRNARAHWGLPPQLADRPYPGDALVPTPRWSWTHGVEIEAPSEAVWPWVAQIGAGKAGFYSYQWLENLAGCDLQNAEVIHPEWAHRAGDDLVLHPSMPPLRVVEVDWGRHLVAFGAPDEAARAAGKPWTAASWVFVVEPLGADRARFISRFRADCSDDFATRLAFGPTFVEPIGFAMDRRMLLGVKARAERAARAPDHLRNASAGFPASQSR